MFSTWPNELPTDFKRQESVRLSSADRGEREARASRSAVELQTKYILADPSDSGLDTDKAREFDPDNLLAPRTLDEFDLTATLREVIGVNYKVQFAGSTKLHLRVDGYATS